MAELDIPITCPDCGAGMTSSQCYACGFDVALGADDSPPTDKGHPRLAEPRAEEPARPAPRTSSPSIKRAPAPRGGGYPFLVLLCLVEWALAAAALVLLFAPEVVAPYLEGVELHLERLQRVGGNSALIALAGLSVPVAGFLLARQRWAWILAMLVGAAWCAAGYLLAEGEAPARLALSLAPGGVALLLVLLSVRAPGRRAAPRAR